MKKKRDYRILLIIILTIIFICLTYLYIKKITPTNQFPEINMTNSNFENIDSEISKSPKQTTEKLKSTSEVESALTEQVELHATYYLSEIYFSNNEFVAKDTPILKYTNDEELLAPYDCVINNISLPETEGRCTNEHYIQISSSNVLQVSMRVSEENINKLKIGQEAKIEIPACDKTYTGNIIDISNTASNGRFTITIEFENDGNIKIGMSANIEIEI